MRHGEASAISSDGRESVSQAGERGALPSFAARYPRGRMRAIRWGWIGLVIGGKREKFYTVRGIERLMAAGAGAIVAAYEGAAHLEVLLVDEGALELVDGSGHAADRHGLHGGAPCPSYGP